MKLSNIKSRSGHRLLILKDAITGAPGQGSLLQLRPEC
jgi:hypothetical protein